MRFAQRVAVVTGGGGGIGHGIGCRLLAEGSEVYFVDLREDLVGPGVVEAALGERSHGARCDVTDPDSVAALVDRVMSEVGRIDVLVNCAGIGTQAPFLDTPLDLWQRGVAINLTGTFLASQAVARVMAQAGRGSIVSIASISGMRAGTGRTVYGTTKAAIVHLTRQMAIELASRGVRVNAVSPGPVDTELARRAHTATQRERYHRQIPMARYGSIEEVAAAVLFLASDEASYITGHNLVVDGGFVAAGLLTPEDGG